MTYDSPEALRMALEDRLANTARESGLSLDRLRRRVVFERIATRLQVAEPRAWVVKGGMALEVRLRDSARLTKDIELGLRGDFDGPEDLHDRLVEALAADPFGDWFVFRVEPPTALKPDGAGHLTWRSKISAHLAGRMFGGVKLDISPRSHELDLTEEIDLPNTLDFAGIDTATIEIIDLHRHAAEKFHAMLRDFGEHENTRVRDLIDLVLLREHLPIDLDQLREMTRQVWHERDQADPPVEFPELPASWPDRYEAIATQHDLTITYPEATTIVGRLWAELFPNEET